MTKLYEVPAEFAAKARYRREDYQRLYEESVRDPEGFWGRMGKRVDWIRPYTRIKDVSYDAANFHIRWYEDGQLNAPPAATRPRSSGRATTPPSPRRSPTASCITRCASSPTR